jgi:5'-3' exonuclease
MVEFEADDALATAAARFAASPEVEQVFIASPDKDLAQCVVGTRVVCLDRMRKKLLDEAGVSAKFGVTPAQIPDYLALVGDSADGIPGVPRWGAKSAAAVLTAYGSLENIPDSAESWRVPVRGAAALAESLASRRTDALLYKRLATLRLDVPLTENLADMAYQGARREPLEALAAELSDATLVERVPQFV